MSQNLNLHEEPRAEGPPDVHVVVLGGEVRGGALEVESVHDAAQLLPHVVRRLEAPVVAEVVVAPCRVLHVLFECVVDVEEGEVVAVDVGESQLGVVGRLLGLVGPHEALRHRQHRRDGQDLVRAVVLARGDQHLGQLKEVGLG